jgi:L-fuconolactonase
MAEVIDAHHHLWRYNESEFGWISPEIKMLRRDFLPAELCCEMAKAGVHGAVAVQACESLAETRWLLECAEANPWIRGVVGWLPLLEGDVAEVVREFAGAEKLKGVRYVVQAEADDFVLREDFNAGVAALRGTGLVYDILIFERHLANTVEFVSRHPEQRFVLDHVAKPKIRAGEMEPWRENLFALAENGNVYCKLSGMVTEADWGGWTLDGLRPYLDAALEAFGPERLMAGSDWPVCLLASGYGQWWEVLREWLRDWNAEQTDMILGGTATRVYQL